MIIASKNGTLAVGMRWPIWCTSHGADAYHDLSWDDIYRELGERFK